MASKKPGAPKGATNASVAAAAPVAVTEDKVTEVVQAGLLSAETADAAQGDATVETAVNAQLSDEGNNSDALQALGFGGPLDGNPVTEWPRTYRVTNNTRMHLCIPAHRLTVERFGAHTDIVIASEDALVGLKSEMGAIAFLNSFGDEDFKLEHVAGA